MSARGNISKAEAEAMWLAVPEERRAYIERHLADLATKAGIVMQYDAAESWKAALAVLRAAAEPKAKAKAKAAVGSAPSRDATCIGCGERHGYEYNQWSRWYQCRACSCPLSIVATR